HARRSIDGSAHGTVQPGEKDAVEHFFPADSAKIRPRVLAVERPTESAVAVHERAMMAQQVQTKANAGKTGAPGNAAIEEQVLEASAAIAAATVRILNADAEFALAHQRRETQALYESAHRTKGIAGKSHAAIYHESLDAIGGHASAHASLGFQHQGFKPAILQAHSCTESGDASADHDDVRVRCLPRAHQGSP